MTRYSAVAGATQNSFNDLSLQLHRTIYPNAPFRGELELDKPVKLQVNYDFQRAFVFRFQNSALVAEYKANLLETWTQSAPEAAPDAGSTGTLDGFAARLQGADAAALIDEMVDTRASFDVLAEKAVLKVAIQGRPVRDFEATLTIGAVARFDANWKLVPQVLTGQVRLTGQPDPEFERLLNRFVIPLLLPSLNEFLGKGFELPPLEFEGVEFAPPQVRVQDGVVAGYAALKGQVTQAPERITVGQQLGVFVQFDDAVANGATDNILRITRQSGQAHGKEEWEPGMGIEGHARYSVGLRNPRFALQPGNRTLAGLDAYGSGRAEFRAKAFWTWGPWVGVGLSISADPQVAASVLLTDGWVRFHEFTLTRALNVKLAFDNLPGWINDLLSKILDAFLTAIAQLITNMIALLKIPVFKLPEVDTTIGGIKLKIRLDRTGIDTLEADGKRLCEVAGVVVVLSQTSTDQSDATTEVAA